MNEQLEKTKEFLIANIRMVAFVVGLVLLGAVIALNMLDSGALPPLPEAAPAPAAGGAPGAMPGGAMPGAAMPGAAMPGAATPGMPDATGGVATTPGAATPALPAPQAVRAEWEKNTVAFEQSPYANLGAQSPFAVQTAAPAAPAP